IDSFVWSGKKDPILAGVEADRRRPNTASGLNFRVPLMRQVFQRVIDDRPIDQVFGMQYRQSRRAVETGRRQIKIFTDTNHIRIGVIGVENRITISAVLLVGPPRVREIRRASRVFLSRSLLKTLNCNRRHLIKSSFDCFTRTVLRGSPVLVSTLTFSKEI